jgi:hypothetical protein
VTAIANGRHTRERERLSNWVDPAVLRRPEVEDIAERRQALRHQDWCWVSTARDVMVRR